MRRLLVILALCFLLVIPASATYGDSGYTITPTNGTLVYSDDEVDISCPAGTGGCNNWTQVQYIIADGYGAGTIQVYGNSSSLPGSGAWDVKGWIIPSGYSNVTGRVACLMYTSGAPGYRTSKYWPLNITPAPPSARVTFHVTDQNNFSHKLSGATVTVSNGQTGTTNSSGIAIIKIVPPDGNYSFTASASGYAPQTVGLGTIGSTGGDAYAALTRDPTYGTIRTYFKEIDGPSGNTVDNPDIDLKDVENGTWSNLTADSQGVVYIDTLSNHSINAYGSATGYISVERLGLWPSEQIYELVMWSTAYLTDPGTGNVNLAISVYDRDTLDSLVGASVSVTDPAGNTQGDVTGPSGSTFFAVPNKSVIHINVNMAGYTGSSSTITTTDFGPDTDTIDLGKEVVTITTVPTLPGGGINTNVTIDPRTPSQKEEDLMTQILDNAPTLISIAMLFTALYMMGWKP